MWINSFGRSGAVLLPLRGSRQPRRPRLPRASSGWRRCRKSIAWFSTGMRCCSSRLPT